MTTSYIYQDVETTLNDQAQVAANWYSDNFLTSEQGKVSSYGYKETRERHSKHLFQVDNEEIEQTKLLKLLGVNIDHQPSFSEHVKCISLKSSQKIGVF